MRTLSWIWPSFGSQEDRGLFSRDLEISVVAPSTSSLCRIVHGQMRFRCYPLPRGRPLFTRLILNGYESKQCRPQSRASETLAGLSLV
jgi:hypothetical protein